MISSAARFKTDGVAGFGTVRIGCSWSKWLYVPTMKSCREPGGCSKGGTGYPLEAPYASASGPVSENTGPDSARTMPPKTSVERNASSKRRTMVHHSAKSTGSSGLSGTRQQPAIARRLHLSNLREVFWFRACRGGSIPRRECQRDDKDDDRHGYQAVGRCRYRLCGDDGSSSSG